MKDLKSRLPRLYVNKHLSSQVVLSLDTSQHHYLVNVLRLKKGESVRVFNGRDGEWEATLCVEGKKKASLICEHFLRPQIESPKIVLLFCPVKKHRQEFLLEKAAELGVSEFFPIFNSYTDKRLFNLQKSVLQVIEASEQCERLSIPCVQEPQSLEGLLKKWPVDYILYVCLERKENPSLAYLLKPSSKVAFLVGPEGGFSEEDIKLMESYSFVRFVTLGPSILRSETAALVALGIYMGLCSTLLPGREGS